MKIAILGAGALGCYYGARLQESGQDVSFIVRSEYGYLKEHGLQVKSLHGNISLPRINVYRDTEEVGPVDLVVVAWKSTANAGFSRALPPLMGPDTTVVTLQNAMGNAEEIARIIPAERIYVGLCFICAMREKPGHVNHLEGGLQRGPPRRIHGYLGRPSLQGPASRSLRAGMGTSGQGHPQAPEHELTRTNCESC